MTSTINNAFREERCYRILRSSIMREIVSIGNPIIDCLRSTIYDLEAILNSKIKQSIFCHFQLAYAATTK